MKTIESFKDIHKEMCAIAKRSAELSEAELNLVRRHFTGQIDLTDDALARLATYHAISTLINVNALNALVYLREKRHGWDQTSDFDALSKALESTIGRLDWIGPSRIVEAPEKEDQDEAVQD